MSKHTPGPWIVPQSFGTQYVEARIDRGILQEVAACGPTQEPEQQYANARLISAAPDLLEALIECRKAMHRFGLEGTAADQDAEAAIAKATGEQA